MSKKIKIGIKDISKLEFEILENAATGDYFNLNEINEIDFSNVTEKIKNKQNELFEKQLEEAKKNWINEYKASIEYQDLVKKNNNLKNQIEIVRQEEQLKLINAINNLKSENLVLQKKVESEVEKTKLETSSKYNTEINKLSSQLRENEIQSEHKIENLKRDHENKIAEIERKKSQNVKVIGENLEKWINDEFNVTLGLIEDCELEKTTISIGGTKPDFLFKVIDIKDQSILGTVTIEAKSQFSVSSTNIKNKDYFERLELNRKNKNSEFSLLISELEPEDSFCIKRVQNPKFENMFIVRPQYFIVFLSIIRFIYLKRRELKGIQADLKTKQEILSEFETMKNEILANGVKNIESNLLSIDKSADKILSEAQKIRDEAQKTLNRHLNTIKNKIENFKINRLTKKLD